MTLTKRDLMGMLPRFYDDSPEVDAIMSANASEIDRARLGARDVLAQFFVTTAGAHGLNAWERVLALSPRPNSSVNFRRNRILARLNGTAPATLRYLTDVVNAHVADKSARIVEYADEYRFEVEVDTDNIRDIGSIYRDINQVKPAHLGFGVSGVIGTVLNISTKEYTFPIPYPITGTFHTAPVNGIATKATSKIESKPYDFLVPYPITGTFYCASGRRLNAYDIDGGWFTDDYLLESVDGGSFGDEYSSIIDGGDFI